MVPSCSYVFKSLVHVLSAVPKTEFSVRNELTNSIVVQCDKRHDKTKHPPAPPPPIDLVPVQRESLSNMKKFCNFASFSAFFDNIFASIFFE